MARGRFITFEGGEGAGKSTQLRLLAAAMSRTGIPVCMTREPGGSPGAEEIRTLLVTGAEDRWDPVSEALLHFAARADHLRRLILPRLDAGEWVLSDRFADSTMAYQGYALGLGRAAVDSLSNMVLKGFAPDLTFIIDIPPEIGLERAERKREIGTRYHAMGTAFHQQVRDAFLAVGKSNSSRCAILDGLEGIQTIHGLICQEVKKRFSVRFA